MRTATARTPGRRSSSAESLDQVTFETDRKCRVETGQWFGAFTGVYVEDPGDVDVDHLVPLKNAHLSGAWAWNPAMKEEYANYLEDPDHLIAVTAGANRSKGARGPEEWMPPDETYWCEYAQGWAEIKAWWELTMTDAEAEAVVEMLGTCERPPDVELEMLGLMVIKVGEHKPTEELQNPVYRSCEGSGVRGGAQVPGEPGRRPGLPEGDGPERQRRGRRRCSM